MILITLIAIDMKWNSTYEPAPGVSPIYFSILWLGMVYPPCSSSAHLLPTPPLSLSLLCSARSQCSNGCISQITIPSNDTYTFATYGNAGVRMWLGGHLLIDDVASVTPRTNVSSCFFSPFLLLVYLCIIFHQGRYRL